MYKENLLLILHIVQSRDHENFFYDIFLYSYFIRSVSLYSKFYKELFLISQEQYWHNKIRPENYVHQKYNCYIEYKCLQIFNLFISSIMSIKLV